MTFSFLSSSTLPNFYPFFGVAGAADRKTKPNKQKVFEASK